MSIRQSNRVALWLYRSKNRRKLWWGGGIVLALTVLAQLFWPVHGHFGFDAWVAFNAVYGFVSCAIMVVVARWLGRFVKRSEDYYDNDV